MRIGRLSTIPIFLLVIAAWTSPAWATPFSFDITFDGTTASIDGSSDPITGTSLIPGDTFSLDIHAAASDYWEVNTTFLTGLYATFYVEDTGTRTGNITTTLFLNGSQVAQATQLNRDQAQIHIGGDTFSFVAGTQFDQLVVDYTFLSASAPFTTIQPGNPGDGGLSWSPFFRDQNISYVQDTAAPVPEPASLLLLGSGIAGIVTRVRQRRK